MKLILHQFNESSLKKEVDCDETPTLSAFDCHSDCLLQYGNNPSWKRLNQLTKHWVRLHAHWCPGCDPGFRNLDTTICCFFLRILSVPPAVVLKKPGSCCMLTAYRGFWTFLLGAKQCDWVTATGKWSKTWILIWSCVLRDEDQFFHVPFKPEIWKTEHLCSVVAVGVSYLSLKMLH